MIKGDQNGVQVTVQDRLIEDLTQMNKELQEKMKHALAEVKATSNFLANRSLELRDLTEGTMKLSHLLLESGLTKQQHDYLKAIVSSSEMIVAIAGDLQDISKLEAGKVTIESGSFELRATLARLTGMFNDKVAEKGLKLSSEVDANLPSFIIGDAARLSQILFNLLSNAIRFTNEGGIKLVVRAIEQDDVEVKIEFSVQDTGIGIVKSKLDYIFKAFDQSESAISRNYGGTGLGMTIVKSLVELQNGSFLMESEVDKGSTFNFILSYQKDNTFNFKESEPEDVTKEHREHLKGLRILLAEDNKVNQMVTKVLLQEVGVSMTIANDGAEAIKSLELSEFDVVLMDMQMPVMDGYQAMEHIRTRLEPKKRTVPILALTAYSMEEEMEKSKQAGANDYLAKPFEPHQLFTKIEELIGKLPVTKDAAVADDLGKVKEDKITEFAVLKEFTSGKPKLMVSTITVLIEELPKNLKIMNESLIVKDWTKLRTVAHKMKPNIMLIGTDDLRDTIVKIERLAAEELKLEEIPILIKKLDTCMPQIIKELKEKAKALSMELA
ncbi:MAG: response regulator [Flavobacteriales bacterium]|nr:response regulator [Flavobacteriales bacterium]